MKLPFHILGTTGRAFAVIEVKHGKPPVAEPPQVEAPTWRNTPSFLRATCAELHAKRERPT